MVSPDPVLAQDGGRQGDYGDVFGVAGQGVDGIVKDEGEVEHGDVPTAVEGEVATLE